MARKHVHIVPRGKDWTVIREGGKRDSSRHLTQEAAIAAGRRTAQRVKAELVIHAQNGRIRDSDSYGNDPFPPRDMKR